jgi:hypothetical protein
MAAASASTSARKRNISSIAIARRQYHGENAVNGKHVLRTEKTGMAYQYGSGWRLSHMWADAGAATAVA